MKLTFGEAKQSIAGAIGLCDGDPRLDSRINEAVRRLMVSGLWVGTSVSLYICSSSRFITLPREVEVIYEITACPPDELGAPPPANGWYTIQGYSGLLDPDGIVDTPFLDRGEFPTVFDICEFSRIRVYSDVPTEGTSIRIVGLDENQNMIRTRNAEGVYVDGVELDLKNSPQTTSLRFSKVGEIFKSRTEGYVRVYALLDDDTQIPLAVLAPDETVASYRRYFVPELPEEDTKVRVTGKLRWVRAHLDSDILGIRNVDAIKLMCLAIRAEEAGNFPSAAQFTAEAERLLTLERDQYLIDPTNIAERKAAFDYDVKAYAPNTLGYVRGRIALELPGAIKAGKSRLTYAVIQAVEKLVARYNWFATQQRLGVHDEDLKVLEFQPVGWTASTELPYQKYDTIKQMVQAVLLQNLTDPDSLQLGKQMEEQVYQNLIYELEAELETRRHTVYTESLHNDPPESFEHFVSRLALDLPGGLKMSRAELSRYLCEAERKAMDMGKWKDTVATFTIALSPGGEVILPHTVDVILAASTDCSPVTLRNSWYEFHVNGPGRHNVCPSVSSLIDQGYSPSGHRRYRYNGPVAEGSMLRIRAKVKACHKVFGEGELMVIRNFTALKLLVQSALEPEPRKAMEFEELARRRLLQELKSSNGPTNKTLQIQAHGIGMGDMGGGLW